MSYNIDQSVQSSATEIQVLLDKVERDDRLKNILVAAVDTDKVLMEKLRAFLAAPEMERPLDSVTTRRKRMNGWDEGSMLEYSLSKRRRALVGNILDLAREYSEIRSTLLKTSASAAASADVESLNRIYVGSFDFNYTESQIGPLFEPFGRILSINMPRDPVNPLLSRGYCFVEYETKEAAKRAMDSMNNMVVGGRAQRVSLPSVGSVSGSGTGMISEQVGPNPNARLFISNVVGDVSEQQLRSVFECFGALRGLIMVRNSGVTSGQHKGYGFQEFYDEEAASVALISLQGFLFCGKTMQVKKASTKAGPDPNDPHSHVNHAQLQQAQKAAEKISIVGTSAGVTGDRLQETSVSTQRERADLSRRLEASRSTHCVVQCQDIFTPADFAEASTVELEDEMREEFSKHGSVLRLVVVRTPNGHGTVYVQYADSFTALTVRDLFRGRLFAGRRIATDTVQDIPQ